MDIDPRELGPDVILPAVSPSDLARLFVEEYKSHRDSNAAAKAIHALRESLLGRCYLPTGQEEAHPCVTLPKILKGRGFVSPNEHYPQEVIPILSHAPSGSYVSVGTERGFVSAGLGDAFTSLLLIDRDPRVVRFNAINAALLEASTSREDYKALRMNADMRVWRSVAKGEGISDAAGSMLNDLDNYRWWQASVRSDRHFGIFHKKPWPLIPGPFKGANYLHYDEQFERIKGIADMQLVSSAVVDLGDSSSRDLLCHILEESAQKISVLDLSNAWQYLPKGALEKLLLAVKPFVSNESIFLITKAKPCGWAYMGWTFGEIFKEPGKVLLPKVIIRSISAGHAGLQKFHGKLDGRNP